MCKAKDIRPCERDELMTLVKGLQRQIAQLQGQNAQLAAANEAVEQATRRTPASRKAPGGSVLEGQAKQQSQASRAQAWYGVVQLPQAALSR